MAAENGNDCQCGDHRYTFTRAQLINALARLEVSVRTTGSMAGKVLADSFADALIEALEDGNSPDDPLGFESMTDEQFLEFTSKHNIQWHTVPDVHTGHARHIDAGQSACRGCCGACCTGVGSDPCTCA